MIDIMEQMREDTISMMTAAERELFKIVEPINYTNVKYSDKSKFFDQKGFEKAWEQIKKIIGGHQWLKAQYPNFVK